MTDEQPPTRASAWSHMIDMHNPADLAAWANRFGVTEITLIAAILRIGAEVKALANHLRIMPDTA